MEWLAQIEPGTLATGSIALAGGVIVAERVVAMVKSLKNGHSANGGKMPDECRATVRSLDDKVSRHNVEVSAAWKENGENQVKILSVLREIRDALK